MQLMIGGLLIVAGLFVALSGDRSTGLPVFGWVLVVIGVLGVAAGLVLRRRR